MGHGGGRHWLVWMELRLPLLIFPCTIKSSSSVLAPAHPGDSGQRAVNRFVCVCVIIPCVLIFEMCNN